jgi:hypothetical protein
VTCVSLRKVGLTRALEWPLLTVNHRCLPLPRRFFEGFQIDPAGGGTSSQGEWMMSVPQRHAIPCRLDDLAVSSSTLVITLSSV